MLIMLYNLLMKKEIKDKLIEAGSFFACILVLLAIGYFTGFIKGFSPEDFQEAYNRTAANLTKSSAKKVRPIGLIQILQEADMCLHIKNTSRC